MLQFLAGGKHARSEDDALASKVPRVSKPLLVDHVGSGAAGLLHDEAALAAALAHLREADPALAVLISNTSAAELVVQQAPTRHAEFIFLSEWVVRSRASVKAANTMLQDLKRKTGGVWTPAALLSHEATLRATEIDEHGRKLEIIFDLARFCQRGLPDLMAMSDRDILTAGFDSVKGIGKVGILTLLVRMGRPNVLVAGDGLVNKWLDDTHGIPQDDTKVAAERARFDATATWAPYRSVGYLLINAAKGATLTSVLA